MRGKIGTYFVLAIFLCGAFIQGTFAETDETYTGFDLAEDGNGIFSAAYYNNSQRLQQYLEQGFDGFSEKLSYELYLDGRLSDVFEACGGCETDLILSSYDEAVINYILENYDLFTEEYDVRAFELDLSTVALKEHLNESASGKLTSSNTTIVYDMATSLAISIIDQIREQADAFEAVGTLGIGLDGEGGDEGSSGSSTGSSDVAYTGPLLPVLLFGTKTSSTGGSTQPGHDVMSAVGNLFGQFLCDPPEREGYTNTVFNQGSQLLTGGSGSVGYGGGTFLFGYDSSDSGSSDGDDGVDTDIGVSVEFQKNSSRVKGAFFADKCEGKDTFETMYRELLDWVVRELDKKNLDCKRENTKHFFEPNFSLSGLGKFFKNVFTGVSINVTSQRPPFLQGSDFNTKGEERKTKEQESQENKELLAGIFARNGLASFPGNSSFLIRKGDEYAALTRGTAGADQLTEPVRDVDGALDAQKQGQPAYEDYVNQQEREQTKHVNSSFVELRQFFQSFFRSEKDMEKRLEYLNDKQECE